jgi:hypothetical protein
MQVFPASIFFLAFVSTNNSLHERANVYFGGTIKALLGTVNPITQKYTDREMETMVRELETSSTTKVLNQAWDKQIQREAHFDILTQQPKRGHIHEVLTFHHYKSKAEI